MEIIDLVIELCSGAGKSLGEGDNVVRIDVNRKMKPTIIADIRYLPLRAGLRPKLCHASPPCKYFSLGHIRRFGYTEEGIAEALRLVAACFDAFKFLEAQTWTLENPQGLLNRIVPPTARTSYVAYDCIDKKTWFWSNRKDAMERAMIPKAIGQKLLEVAEIE